MVSRKKKNHRKKPEKLWKKPRRGEFTVKRRINFVIKRGKLGKVVLKIRKIKLYPKLLEIIHKNEQFPLFPPFQCKKFYKLSEVCHFWVIKVLWKMEMGKLGNWEIVKCSSTGFCWQCILLHCVQLICKDNNFHSIFSFSNDNKQHCFQSPSIHNKS